MKVEIPPLDPRDAKPCDDPGVDQNALTALTKNRAALLECAKTKANVTAQYEDVRTKIGGSS